MKFEDLYDPSDYVTPESMDNLKELWLRVSKFQDLCGIDLICTSGFRTRRKHAQIYAQMNAKLIAAGKSAVAVPIGSKHLTGQAVDCYDPAPMLALRIWMKLHPTCLEDCNLWAEEFDATPRVHLQSVKFASYQPGATRYFKP